MIRNIKALGLAFVAVFAMSAVAASAAQAAGSFNWDSGTTTLERTSNESQVFTTTPGKVTCSEVVATATGLTGTSATSVTTTSLTYSNAGAGDKCSGPFGTQPKIEMNNCNYVFHAEETVGGSESKVEGKTDIACPGTSQIVINALLCTIKVPAQTGLSNTVFENNATSPTSVVINPSITGIHYTTSGASCGTHTETNGTYGGKVTVVGKNSGGTTTNVSVK